MTGAAAAGDDQASAPKAAAADPVLAISALSGDGLPQLVAHLQALAGADADREGTFSARRRHVDALRRAGSHLQLAGERLQVDRAGELVAEELSLAQQALAEITGAYTPTTCSAPSSAASASASRAGAVRPPAPAAALSGGGPGG